MRRLGPTTLLLVLAAAACLSSPSPPTTGDGTTTTRGTTTTATTVPTTTEGGAPQCAHPIAPPPTDSTVHVPGDPAGTALNISFFTFRCASNVVVVSTADTGRVAVAARLAAALDAPLLFASGAPNPNLDAEIARLGPERLVVVGADATATPPEYTEVERLPGALPGLTRRVNTMIGALATAELPTGGGVPAVATVVEAIEGGLGLVPPPPPPPPVTTTTGAATTVPSTTTLAPTTTAPMSPPDPLAANPVVFGRATRGEAWLVDGDSPEMALAATVAAHASGGVMAIVDGEDLRRIPEVGRALRLAPVDVDVVHTLGDIAPGIGWQVRLLREGSELPGGGYLLFEETRMVALYGNPLTAALGVLGEQGPVESAERAAALADPYRADGRSVIPAFEVIATVAAAEPGLDGNYSNETERDVIRPWIEEAGRRGLYVLLDFQPGRTDFITQAMLYEEFLRRPHVGLALDPEWRLDPGEFHLETFGGVDAAEVNGVIDWLAELVRQEALPQKMLLLHQFRLSMLPDREQITMPPELAVVVQMDGQGTIPDKLATWEVLTTQPDSGRLLWGWKNFFDEDSPAPLTPAEVLELRPEVVYVSYQ